MSVSEMFPNGILRPELFMGLISSVSAYSVRVNLTAAGSPSGSHFYGGRYGRGEVGEFVIIEGQVNLLLGRVVEVELPEQDRRAIKPFNTETLSLDAIGKIQLLGSISMDNMNVFAGVENYPRLGDRVYAAPHEFVAKIPTLMDVKDDSEPILLKLGSIDIAQESKVAIKPEKLFGRHCAILGATGGGKSWTTAKIVEECIKYKSKIVLLDATGEYRDFSGEYVQHCHLGNPLETASDSVACSLPPTSFIESDFIALFEPAGKVQGPKMRAAIRSLRLAKLCPNLAPDGYIKKINQPKIEYEAAATSDGFSSSIDNPRQEFDVTKLVSQIEQECVYPDGFSQSKKDTSKWGGEDGNFSHCLSLIARINGVLTSPAFSCVFCSGEIPITNVIDEFLLSSKRLLRICLSDIAYEYKAREIITNVIGRHFLIRARKGNFKKTPLLLILDEAHNFLGRQIGSEDTIAYLDAFELIAKEGRKYGLNICLATQRPRDITEGVLSQIGTLIVHRLTNDRDREVVERACGEIDRAASSFLPNLKPGEAAIIGVDFPIPLTIQIDKPSMKPLSNGPDFQKTWRSLGV